MALPFSGGPTGWRIVTALWGQRFVERFLTTTLPSVLAPDNLPALAAGETVEYRIYTEASDVPVLEGNPLFRKLRDTVEVTVELIDSVVTDQKYDRLSQIHRMSLSDAAQNDIGIVFFTPDAIWGNGTLAAVRAIAARGYQAILMDGPRVVERPFMAEIAKYYGKDGSLLIPPRLLTELSVDHIHPNEASWEWSSDRIHDVPFQLHWAVLGEGMLTRGFCLHPIYIRLKHPVGNFVGTIDHGLLDVAVDDFSAIYYCRDSDEMSWVSLDELGFSSANIKRTDKSDRILRIAKWAHQAATPQNLHALNRPARRHYTEADPAKWRRAERVSATHVGAILACRELLILHDKMHALQLTGAAGLLALALHERGLTRRLGAPGHRTFLVPTDSAIAAADLWRPDGLISPGRASDFRDALRRCVLAGRYSATEVMRIRSDFSVVQGDIAVGDNVMHVVDRVPV